MSSQLRTCAVCSAKSSLLCSKCKIVYYCSKEHQVEHWKLHKEECMPFRLKIHPNYVIPKKIYEAKKNILEGSVLFAVRPFMVFPIIPLQLNQSLRHNMKICVGCCKQLESEYLQCTRCKWPVCNKTCQDNPYHSRLECSVLANREVNGYYYLFDDTAIPYNRNCILRALLMKVAYPDKWEKLEKMPWQVAKARNRDNSLKKQHLEFTRKFVQEECKQIQFSAQLIERVFWILEQNMNINRRVQSCGYLNNMSNHISQGCLSNVISYHSFKSDDPDTTVLEKIERRYYASRDIKKGDFLTLPILDLTELHGTPARRQVLLQSVGMDCKCTLCADPTEFGTYLTGIVCKVCRRDGNNNSNPNSGYLLPKNPFDFSSGWKCTTCPQTMDSDTMQRVVLGFIGKFISFESDKNIFQHSMKICVDLNEKAADQGRELRDSEMRTIELAVKQMENVLSKNEKIINQNNVLHPSHESVLVHIRFRQVTLLYLYLSLNMAEEFHPGFWSYQGYKLNMSPSFKFFANLPKNWIQLHAELRDKTAAVLHLFGKILPPLSLHCGTLFFYITFSKFTILKENAKKNQNYDLFLADLKDWSVYKHKADLCYRNKDADDHFENPDFSMMIEILKKMDSADPSIQADTMSLFTRIVGN